MKLDTSWWRVQVVRPALQSCHLWSESAEVLLTGTALCESNLTWIRQHGNGPALGPYQVEPATHRSLWNDLLRYRLELAEDVMALVGRDAHSLPTWNWRGHADRLQPSLVAWCGAQAIPQMWWYSTAIARCRYLWDPDPLPAPDDVRGMAQYYKRSYNSELGAGTVEKAIPRMLEAMEAT